MADYYWRGVGGTGSGLWDVAGNWSNSPTSTHRYTVLPGASDRVLLFGADYVEPAVLTLRNNQTIGSIVFNPGTVYQGILRIRGESRGVLRTITLTQSYGAITLHPDYTMFDDDSFPIRLFFTNSNQPTLTSWNISVKNYTRGSDPHEPFVGLTNLTVQNASTSNSNGLTLYAAEGENTHWLENTVISLNGTSASRPGKLNFAAFNTTVPKILTIGGFQLNIHGRFLNPPDPITCTTLGYTDLLEIKPNCYMAAGYNAAVPASTTWNIKFLGTSADTWWNQIDLRGNHINDFDIIECPHLEFNTTGFIDGKFSTSGVKKIRSSSAGTDYRLSDRTDHVFNDNIVWSHSFPGEKANFAIGPASAIEHIQYQVSGWNITDWQNDSRNIEVINGTNGGNTDGFKFTGGGVIETRDIQSWVAAMHTKASAVGIIVQDEDRSATSWSGTLFTEAKVTAIERQRAVTSFLSSCFTTVSASSKIEDERDIRAWMNGNTKVTVVGFHPEVPKDEQRIIAARAGYFCTTATMNTPGQLHTYIASIFVEEDGRAHITLAPSGFCRILVEGRENV